MLGALSGKGSGFSFVDLAADLAGIEFASLLLQAERPREESLKLLERLAGGFQGSDFLPDLSRLAKDPGEGLGSKEFGERYGSLTDPRFLEEVRRIREEVLRSPGYPRQGPEESKRPGPRASR